MAKRRNTRKKKLMPAPINGACFPSLLLQIPSNSFFVILMIVLLTGNDYDQANVDALRIECARETLVGSFRIIHTTALKLRDKVKGVLIFLTLFYVLYWGGGGGGGSFFLFVPLAFFVGFFWVCFFFQTARPIFALMCAVGKLEQPRVQWTTWKELEGMRRMVMSRTANAMQTAVDFVSRTPRPIVRLFLLFHNPLRSMRLFCGFFFFGRCSRPIFSAAQTFPRQFCPRSKKKSGNCSIRGTEITKRLPIDSQSSKRSLKRPMNQVFATKSTT